MKRLMLMFAMLISFIGMAYAQGEVVTDEPGFLSDFGSFVGIATLVIPTVVGFINDKLAKPMNKWVTYWVTGLVGIAVTYFSWYFELGFPPADAEWWIVLIDAIFIGLAATGIVSVLISEWLANLISNKHKK